MNPHSVKFGSDAEFFIQTPDGKPFPITSLIGGTKEHPRKVEELMGMTVEGFAMQEDNAALEVNIPPTQSFQTFMTYMSLILQHAQQQLPPSLSIDYQRASVELDESYVDAIPALRRFGCEPDYNCWTMQTNPKPHPKSKGFRSAAAHVHIGWDNPTDDERLELVRWADALVSTNDLRYQNDSERERRTLYGRAGAFRWKNYGIEHRVGSNLWAVDEGRCRENLTAYLWACLAVSKGMVVPKDAYADIVSAINDHKVEEGYALSTKFINEISSKVDAKERKILFTAFR